MFLVHILDEQGNFELIDSEMRWLYPNLAEDNLIELTDKQYQTYCEQGTANTRFLDGEFVFEEIKVDPALLLEQAKTAKLNEINRLAQAFVNSVAKLDETPEFERSTWQEQANEARAWFENRETPTPKLDLLAQQRGVPAEVLRMKCYEKATAFYQLSFIVAGQRQGLEDRLKQATTLEEIEAIEIAYQLPQGGEQ